MMKLLALAASAAVTAAAPAADVVTSLPGWGAPLTTTYSGYLDIPGGKHLHYLFFTSQGTPSSDPVVLWLNGGPGCSSLEGAFQEGGPLWTAPGGQGLQLNNYSWNKFANTLYLEAPACVGFSKADSLAGCVHNDTGTAYDNLAALQQFYVAFPEFATNDFWITGESYAGIYIPMLAQAIVEYNAGAGSASLPLKGIAVGNGCIGNGFGVCSELSDFGNYLSALQLYGHGFISQDNWKNVEKDCPPLDGDWTLPSLGCTLAIDAASNDASGNFDVYDMYNGAWGICPYGGALDSGKPMKRKRAPHARRPVGRLSAKLLQASGEANVCTNDDDLSAYLNLASVQAALHVTAPAGGWQECGGPVYERTMQDERKEVYPALQAAGLQIYIINGDADACVPVTDNEFWTRSMGYPVKQSWTPWSADDGTLGGYVTEYNPPKGTFTFVTVRLAGHMVPQTQPAYSHDLMKRIFNGSPIA